MGREGCRTGKLSSTAAELEISSVVVGRKEELADGETAGPLSDVHVGTDVAVLGGDQSSKRGVQYSSNSGREIGEHDQSGISNREERQWQSNLWDNEELRELRCEEGGQGDAARPPVLDEVRLLLAQELLQGREGDTGGEYLLGVGNAGIETAGR